MADVGINAPLRQASPDAAAPQAADAAAPFPAAAPVAPPLSTTATALAAFWEYKDRYGLLALSLVGALLYLYYTYWKPSQEKKKSLTPSGASACA